MTFTTESLGAPNIARRPSKTRTAICGRDALQYLLVLQHVRHRDDLPIGPRVVAISC